MKMRKEILVQLIKIDGNLSNIIKKLNNFDWDSDDILVTIRPQDIALILKKYTLGELSSELLETWANAIESREDVDFEQSSEELINEVVFELANPLLTQELTIDRGVTLLTKLNY